MKDAFLWITKLDYYLIPIIVLLVAILIFALCVIIEKARIVLFKFLRIEELILALSRQLRKILSLRPNT